MNAAEIARALGGERRSGAGWKCLCPAHRDTNPSLDLKDGSDGRILAVCRAGCSQEALVAELKSRNLWPDRNGASDELRRREYRLNYVDGSGEAIHVRVDLADGAKRFFWTPKGTKPSNLELYGISEALAGARDRVVLCEGERATDALRARNIVAAGTVTGAAGQPCDKVLKQLLQFDRVVLWPDNDPPGARHMQRIAARLTALGAEDVRVVRWPEAPPNGDAADFRGDDEALRGLIETATSARDFKARLRGRMAIEVEPRAVQWLWPGRIPLGKLSDFQGDPSVGKSTVTLDIAAHVSTGSAFPDGAACEPGGVIIVSAEDDSSDTLRPRLEVAGANLSRVRLVTLADGLLTLPDDVGELAEAIRADCAKLVVLDPLDAFVSDKIDGHKNQSVRRLLAALAAVAADTGAACAVLRHLNKDSRTNNPMYRGGGSIGLNAAARAVWLAAARPGGEPAEYVLACVKSNLAPHAASLGYRLVERMVGGIATVGVQWQGTVEITARELLTEPSSARGPRPDKLEAAKDLVAEFLADGREHPSAALDALVRQRGLSHGVIMEARRALGVRAKRLGFGGAWTLWLPKSQKPLDSPKNSDSMVIPFSQKGSTKSQNFDSMGKNPKSQSFGNNRLYAANEDAQPGGDPKTEAPTAAEGVQGAPGAEPELCIHGHDRERCDDCSIDAFAAHDECDYEV